MPPRKKKVERNDDDDEAGGTKKDGILFGKGKKKEGKKKGLSCEEKREALLCWWKKQNNFFDKKTLEKHCKSLGIVNQYYKEIIEGLIAEDIVLTDRVGASTVYWLNKDRHVRKLEEIEKLRRSLEKLEIRLKEMKEGPQEMKGDKGDHSIKGDNTKGASSTKGDSMETDDRTELLKYFNNNLQIEFTGTGSLGKVNLGNIAAANFTSIEDVNAAAANGTLGKINSTLEKKYREMNQEMNAEIGGGNGGGRLLGGRLGFANNAPNNRPGIPIEPVMEGPPLSLAKIGPLVASVNRWGNGIEVLRTYLLENTELTAAQIKEEFTLLDKYHDVQWDHGSKVEPLTTVKKTDAEPKSTMIAKPQSTMIAKLQSTMIAKPQSTMTTKPQSTMIAKPQMKRVPHPSVDLNAPKQRKLNEQHEEAHHEEQHHEEAHHEEQHHEAHREEHLHEGAYHEEHDEEPQQGDGPVMKNGVGETGIMTLKEFAKQF